MHEGMKIVSIIFATIGAAHVAKHIMNCKERRYGWHKIKIEYENSNCETVPSDIKVEDKKPTGETAIQFQSKGIFNFTFL